MSHLKAQIDTLEALCSAREPLLQTLLPEPGRFERLRSEAERLQARWPDASARPPLFGIPIAVKDFFHVDGFATRAGSRLPEDLFKGAEADSVTALKRAGALILGKSVTTEFAYFVPGPTRNPRDPTRTPGGSSSGSAAAVGAAMARLALGSQTIGSVIRPASFCGVYGYKPSYDRVSRAGVLPFAPSYDHVGLFGGDLGILVAAARVLLADWSLNTDEWDSSRPVLAVPEGPYLRCCGLEMEVRFRNVCTTLVHAGYSLRSLPLLTDFEAIRDRHYALMAHEVAIVHREWYPRYRNLYHPRTAELMERGLTVSASEAAAARDASLLLRADLERVMKSQGIDLWLSPAAVGAAPRGLENTGDPVMSLPWTQAGLPVLTIPMGGDAEGMPLGLQLTGAFGADEALLGWAAGLDESIGNS